MIIDTTFTPEEFNQQVCEFRKLMGDKNFWTKPEATREAAKTGFIHSYFFLGDVTPTEQEQCATVLTATLCEYSRREMMFTMLGNSTRN